MIRHRKSRVAPPPEGCPLDACLRLVGGTWTPKILWYLRENPRRFMELKGDLQGISAKTLTVRLRRMEKDGVVYREVKPTSPPTVEYGLTDLGRKLLPAIDAIAEVGLALKKAR